MKLLVDWIKENPEYEYLLEEWDTERNREELGLEIGDVSFGCNKKVWWICRECGQGFLQGINKRTCGKNHKDCAILLGRNKYIKKLVNENGSLKDWCIKNNKLYLIEEWNFKRNKKELNLDIDNITYGSNKEAWWTCSKCGEEFKQKISNRTRKGNGHKRCSEKEKWKRRRIKIIEKNGSFKDWCEKNNKLYLLEEWDYERNKRELNITPDCVTYGSDLKVYWIDEYGKTFERRIQKRIRNAWKINVEEEDYYRKYNTSFPEQTIYYYIKQLFPDSINHYRVDWLGRMEIDIYIPSLKLGIEYDGHGWHQNCENDYRKNVLLKEHNIGLVRVRENKCPILLDKDCYYIHVINKDWMNKYIEDLIRYINFRYGLKLNIDVDILNDRQVIKEQFIST